MNTDSTDIAFTAKIIALGMAIAGATAWTSVSVLSQITTSF